MTPEQEAKIREIISEELAKMKTNSNISNIDTQNSKSKTKRTPSKWQIHLKDCIPKQKKELSMGEKVKACSIEYKKVKDKLDIEKIEEQLSSEYNVDK